MSSVSLSSETAGFCDSTTYVVQLVRIMELLYSWKSRKPKGIMIHQSILWCVCMLLIQKKAFARIILFEIILREADIIVKCSHEAISFSFVLIY